MKRKKLRKNPKLALINGLKEGREKHKYSYGG